LPSAGARHQRRELVEAGTLSEDDAASLETEFALRLEMTTLAPSFANSSAEERPMPRLEPVMTATFPVRSNGVFFIVGCSLTLARHSGMRRKAQTRNLEVVGERFPGAQLRT